MYRVSKTHVLSVVLLQMFVASVSLAAQINWNAETKFGASHKNARPAVVKALAAAHKHLLKNPNDTITLQFGKGKWHFEGSQPSFGFPNNFGPGPKGRFIIKGAGMRETTIVTLDPRTESFRGYGLHRITFSGIHFARNYITVTQGRVVEVKAGGQSLLIELHEGFPTPKSLWTIPGKRENQGKYLRRYTDDLDDPLVVLENNSQVPYRINETKNVEGRIWDFKVAKQRAKLVSKYYKKGDVVGIKCKHGGNVYFVQKGDDLVFENCLWTHRARGVFRQGTKNVRFSGCRWERLPKVNGRTPCLSTPGGMPQIGQPYDERISGVVIEDCYFDSSGDDNIGLFRIDGVVIKNCHTRNAFARSILLHDCTDVRIINTKVENGKIQVSRHGKDKKKPVYRKDLPSGTYNIHIFPKTAPDKIVNMKQVND